MWLNNSDNDTPDWVEIVSGSSTLTFAGGDAASGSLTPVTAPADGYYMVANTLWIDDTTDSECPRYEGGGVSGTYGGAGALSGSLTNTGDYIAIHASGAAESSAGTLTFWDDNTHTTTAYEILTDPNWSGTANTCWLRMCMTRENVTFATDSTGSTIPSAYENQKDDTTTYQYKGSSGLLFGSALSDGNTNRIAMHAFVPHNGGAGTSGHTPILSYKYYYT